MASRCALAGRKRLAPGSSAQKNRGTPPTQTQGWVGNEAPQPTRRPTEKPWSGDQSGVPLAQEGRNGEEGGGVRPLTRGEPAGKLERTATPDLSISQAEV